MNIITKYTWLLAVVPFVCFLIYAWFMGYMPKQNLIGKFFDFIAESDLKELLQKNGFIKTPFWVIQLIRLGIGVVLSIDVFVINGINASSVIISAILVFAVYKLTYLYVQNLERARIRKLNQELPYVMKTLVYQALIFPSSNAVQKTLESVDSVFSYDLHKLLEDIDASRPGDFTPYQNWIDRYDGKLKNLDVYLKYIFELTNVSHTEAAKTLAELNKTISDELSYARQQKNDSINFTIGYLGYIPIALLAIILTYFLMMSIELF